MIAKAAKYYIRSYQGLSREIWLLAFVNLINRCGTMVIPFMMLYLTSQLGCSISKAGIVMSLWGIGAFIGSYIGGKLTDKLGFYKIQLFSLFFGGIGFIVLGKLQHYYAICFFTFLLAMVNEAFRPANSAAMGRYSNEENRMRSFTLMRLSFNLGWSVGAGIGGFIAHHSYQLLFWVDGITNILAALMLWYLLPDQYSKQQRNMHAENKEDSSILSDKDFVQFIIISVIFLSCFVQLFTNLPVYFKKELHFQENIIGYLSSWNGLLIVFIEMTVIFWIEKNWPKKRAVTLGVTFHAIAYLLLVMFDFKILGAFVMITFITISEMLAFSVLVSFWMNRTNDSNRGQYAAYWTMTWAAAQIIGPFVGSNIIDNTNFSIWWYCVVILSLLSAFFYAKIIKN